MVLLDDDSIAKHVPMYMNGIGYPYVSIKKKTTLGRFLLGITKKGKEADHIDKNKMNNQMCNLRVVDRRENAWNRARFKNNTTGMIGVSMHKGRYRVRTMDPFGKKISLGGYDTLQEAAFVHDAYVYETRGQYAVFNFPKCMRLRKMNRHEAATGQS